MNFKFESQERYFKSFSYNPELFKVINTNRSAITVLVTESFLCKKMLEYKLGNFNHISCMNGTPLKDVVLGFTRPDFCRNINTLMTISKQSSVKYIHCITYENPIMKYKLFDEKIKEMFENEVKRCQFWNPAIEIGYFVNSGEIFYFDNWKTYKEPPVNMGHVSDKILYRLLINKLNSIMKTQIFQETNIKEEKNTHLNDVRLKNFMKHQ